MLRDVIINAKYNLALYLIFYEYLSCIFIFSYLTLYMSEEILLAEITFYNDTKLDTDACIDIHKQKIFCTVDESTYKASICEFLIDTTRIPALVPYLIDNANYYQGVGLTFSTSPPSSLNNVSTSILGYGIATDYYMGFYGEIHDVTISGNLTTIAFYIGDYIQYVNPYGLVNQDVSVGRESMLQNPYYFINTKKDFLSIVENHLFQLLNILKTQINTYSPTPNPFNNMFLFLNNTINDSSANTQMAFKVKEDTEGKVSINVNQIIMDANTVYYDSGTSTNLRIGGFLANNNLHEILNIRSSSFDLASFINSINFGTASSLTNLFSTSYMMQNLVNYPAKIYSPPTNLTIQKNIMDPLFFSLNSFKATTSWLTFYKLVFKTSKFCCWITDITTHYGILDGEYEQQNSVLAEYNFVLDKNQPYLKDKLGFDRWFYLRDPTTKYINHFDQIDIKTYLFSRDGYEIPLKIAPNGIISVMLKYKK
jgi:hypothetical protein